MQDDLSKVAEAIQLGRRTVRIIQTNIAFALIVKAIFSRAGIIRPSSLWLAILADTGATLVLLPTHCACFGRELRNVNRRDQRAVCFAARCPSPCCPSTTPAPLRHPLHFPRSPTADKPVASFLELFVFNGEGLQRNAVQNKITRTMKTQVLENDTVKRTVRERYGRIAEDGGSCGCARLVAVRRRRQRHMSMTPQSNIARAGLHPDETSAVPEGSNLGLGCGIRRPSPPLSPAKRCSTSAVVQASTHFSPRELSDRPGVSSVWI